MSNSSVREQAAVALGRIGDPSAVQALKEADSKYHRSGFCSLCEALHRLEVKGQT
jgi:HEAT repeat protein